nr:efflux RND transporter permease subunit [uncultured Parasutterella sp.]
MFSNFFIKRPIFAIVTSLVIVIAGLLSMFQLPIEQYPNMAPVQITVTANYPGADARTIRSPLRSKRRSTALTT